MTHPSFRGTRLARAVLVACALLAPVLAQAETADEFVARLNKEFAELGIEYNAAGWTAATYINVDTERLSAMATEHYLKAFSEAVEEAKKFEGQPMSPASRRAIELLKLGVAAPAPNDAAKRTELAKLLAAMEAK
ncbi:MAG TPA: M2 family metallopeptidase, partial [Steroidobacteraceae bacterium]